MAGRIQHYIPQSFQRGFLLSEESQKTHVYRINKIYISNINRVAAQRDFYSKPSSDGKKTLDDVITDYENRLGHLLNSLRAVEIGAVADACMAAEVIAHLTPRGNNVRQIFGNGVKELISGISNIFANQESVMSLLGLNKPSPNKTWNVHIASALNEQKDILNLLNSTIRQAKVPKTSLDRMLFMHIRESFFEEEKSPSEQIKNILFNISSRAGNIIKKTHENILNESLISGPRKILLEEYSWSIHPASAEGAIMPDCIALGFDEEEAAFLPYIMTSTASTVVMPLTSQKLLVGVRAGSSNCDLSNFNRDASECSDELFIAASADHACLSPKIGNRWKRKINCIVQEVLSGYHIHETYHDTVIPATFSTPFEGYQLTFIGWSSKADVYPVSNAVQSFIEKLRSWLDLSQLDGITFTSEFEKTLEDLERGFNAIVSPESIPDYIARGVAAPLVIRDGQLKVRIVLDKEYALSLVDKNIRNAEVTLHLLLAGLSLSHTIKQFENMLPGFLMKPVKADNHDAVLHCAMRNALRAYRYAYDSAGLGADDVIENEFSDYLTYTLDKTHAQIINAKAEHETDSDHPKLFNAARGAATDILISSARLIGHLNGMKKSPLLTPGTPTANALASRQLMGWINAFTYDLQQFWKKESWTLEDLYALNIHVERLLWPFGIFLYPEDSGNGTMIVSLKSS